MLFILVFLFLIFSPFLLRNIADRYFKQIVVYASFLLLFLWSVYFIMTPNMGHVYFSLLIFNQFIPFGFQMNSAVVEMLSFFVIVVYILTLWNTTINIRVYVAPLGLIVLSFLGLIGSINFIQLLFFTNLITILIFFVSFFLLQRDRRHINLLFSFSFISDVLLLFVVSYLFFFVSDNHFMNKTVVSSFATPTRLHVLIVAILIACTLRSNFFLMYLVNQRKEYITQYIVFMLALIPQCVTLFFLYIMFHVTPSVLFSTILKTAFILSIVGTIIHDIIFIKIKKSLVLFYIFITFMTNGSYFFYVYLPSALRSVFLETLLLSILSIMLYSWLLIRHGISFSFINLHWKSQPKFFILWVFNLFFVCFLFIVIIMISNSLNSGEFVPIASLILLTFIALGMGIVTHKIFHVTIIPSTKNMVEHTVPLHTDYRLVRDLKLSNLLIYIGYTVFFLLTWWIQIRHQLHEIFLHHRLITTIILEIYMLCIATIGIVISAYMSIYYKTFLHRLIFFVHLRTKGREFVQKIIQKTHDILLWKMIATWMRHALVPSSNTSQYSLIKVIFIIVIALISVGFAWYGAVYL